jgi:exosome complex component RRP42
MDEEIISEVKKDYIYRLADLGQRLDGRKFDELRPITIRKGIIESAEGSARVTLGDTDVLVGVKMSLGEPYPDAQDKGVLTTAAELIPMASPTFEPGPPREDAIELARVVDRGIRESEAIELDKLCITPGEKVWVIFIDIHVLDYGGNLFDAASIGAISALTTTTVPASRFDAGEDFKLPIAHYPASCTFAKLGNAIILDPDLDEERIASARLTVTTDEHGAIRAMQKGLQGSFKIEEVRKVVDMAIEAGKKVREKILSS